MSGQQPEKGLARAGVRKPGRFAFGLLIYTVSGWLLHESGLTFLLKHIGWTVFLSLPMLVFVVLLMWHENTTRRRSEGKAASVQGS